MTDSRGTAARGNVLLSMPSVLFPYVTYLHLVTAPFTKVEESFNMQATHDVLRYGVPVKNATLKFMALFDHMTFRGSVPRTFVGSIVLAGLSKPFIWLNGVTGFEEQRWVRLVLGLLNAAAVFSFERAINQSYGARVSLIYTILQASQFHIWFYASRTLPNMFAFCLSTFAMSFFLPSSANSSSTAIRTRRALFLLTIATVIFRSELALLMVAQAVYILLRNLDRGLTNLLTILRRVMLPAVFTGAIIGLALTVPIDTYFWQSPRWLWPEFDAFIFNIFPSEGHQGASEWGTSPWNWYFTSALPRLMINPLLLLLPFAALAVSDERWAILDNLMPPMIYTTIYSILPHKETRFLFPIVPSLTLAAAISISAFRKHRSAIINVLTILVVLSTSMAAISSHLILLPLSAQSYPGGNALLELHQYHESLPESKQAMYPAQINVHLTNLALQTGVTRFLEQPLLLLPSAPMGQSATKSPLWIYDKSSDDTLFLTPSFWNTFDYVVVEDPKRVIGAWEIIQETKGLQSQPRLVKPLSGGQRYTPLVLGANLDSPPPPDALQLLLETVWGGGAAWLYAILHDVLRAGVYTNGRSLTNGYWIDWGLETKLYTLRRTQSGISPNP